MYNVGEYVVKVNTGICRIEEIVLMNITGSGEKQYYMLLPIGDNKSKMYVSTDADRKSIRPVMTKQDAEDFMKRAPQIEAVWVPNDKLREQQYKTALKTNEPEELLGIIKNLYKRGQARIAQGKKITSTDEKYFRQAEKALYSELAFSLEVEKEKIEEYITETIRE